MKQCFVKVTVASDGKYFDIVNACRFLLHNEQKLIRFESRAFLSN